MVPQQADSSTFRHRDPASPNGPNVFAYERRTSAPPTPPLRPTMRPLNTLVGQSSPGNQQLVKASSLSHVLGVLGRLRLHQDGQFRSRPMRAMPASRLNTLGLPHFPFVAVGIIELNVRTARTPIIRGSFDGNPILLEAVVDLLNAWCDKASHS